MCRDASIHPHCCGQTCKQKVPSLLLVLNVASQETNMFACSLSLLQPSLGQAGRLRGSLLPAS